MTFIFICFSCLIKSNCSSSQIGEFPDYWPPTYLRELRLKDGKSASSVRRAGGRPDGAVQATGRQACSTAAK